MLANCIIWGDDAAPIHVGSTSPTVAYSDVRGGWAGQGNIDADPLFCAGPAECFYLSDAAAGQAVHSPCLDAGSDTAAHLGVGGLTTRRDEVGDVGIVDMGYHYPVTGRPFLRGDFDRDEDVDCDDFAQWIGFLTGPCATDLCWPAIYTGPCGNVGDFDDDGDTDMRDCAGFQAAFSGSTE